MSAVVGSVLHRYPVAAQTQVLKASQPVRYEIKTAKRIGDVLFGNDMDQTYGVFRSRSLFLIDNSYFDGIINALAKNECSSRYKRHGRTPDRVSVHLATFPLNSQGETLTDSISDFIGSVNLLDPHVIFIELTGVADKKNIEKLESALRRRGNDNRPNRVVLFTKDENTFNSISQHEQNIANLYDFRWKPPLAGVWKKLGLLS